MNRLFTKIMWTVAAIMVCVVFAVLASPGSASHPSAAGHGPRMAAGAGPTGVAATGAARRPHPSP